MKLSRRGLFIGSSALIAAPSIVRAASLMPVSVAKAPIQPLFYELMERINARFRDELVNAMSDLMIYGNAEVKIEGHGSIFFANREQGVTCLAKFN